MPAIATKTLPVERLRDLLVSALEGGSNYWYQVDGVELRDGLTIRDFKSDGKMQPPNEYYHWSQLVPTTPGCTLFVSAPPDFRAVGLNLDALKLGAEVMAEKYPNHFADVLDEDDDAATGDVFLQCCLYGEVVYS